jgi:hypothetical protein
LLMELAWQLVLDQPTLTKPHPTDLKVTGSCPWSGSSTECFIFTAQPLFPNTGYGVTVQVWSIKSRPYLESMKLNPTVATGQSGM